MNPFGNSNPPPHSIEQAIATAPINPFGNQDPPPRSIEQAISTAYRRAYGEWDEFLPHTRPVDTYHPSDPAWLLELAIAAAATPLATILPADQVSSLATALATAAFTACARELAGNEPD